jgi:hypothetical protein
VTAAALRFKKRSADLDFARLRRFRQSLLCRGDAPTDFALQPSRLTRLAATASMSLLQAASAGRMPGSATDPRASEHREILERLVAAAPATIPVAELARLPGSVPGQATDPGAEAAILQAWMAGFVQLRARPIAGTPTPSARPEALPLARWQAGSGDAVTNLRHESIRLTDPFARALLSLLDGRHDRQAMLDALAGGAFGNAAAIAPRIDDTLASFARFGLLVR